MDVSSAEGALIFFIIVYWVFFGVAILRLLLALCDILCKDNKWTYTKTINATIASALLARAVHLTLLRAVNEGDNLFQNPLDEDLLFKILGSIPGYILISVYTLIALLWLSMIAKTYDLSSYRRSASGGLSFFGRTYDPATTSLWKQHLQIFFLVFNIILYTSWIIFFCLMWKMDTSSMYRVEAVFTASIAVLLALIFGGLGSTVYFHFQHNPILSVERLRITNKALALLLVCSVVFIIKLPFIICGIFVDNSDFAAFMFDILTYTFLEILPFLIIEIVIGGGSIEERNDESAHFSFSFRKYHRIA